MILLLVAAACFLAFVCMRRPFGGTGDTIAIIVCVGLIVWCLVVILGIGPDLIDIDADVD